MERKKTINKTKQNKKKTCWHNRFEEAARRANKQAGVETIPLAENENNEEENENEEKDDNENENENLNENDNENEENDDDIENENENEEKEEKEKEEEKIGSEYINDVQFQRYEILPNLSEYDRKQALDNMVYYMCNGNQPNEDFGYRKNEFYEAQKNYHPIICKYISQSIHRIHLFMPIRLRKLEKYKKIHETQLFDPFEQEDDYDEPKARAEDKDADQGEADEDETDSEVHSDDDDVIDPSMCLVLSCIVLSCLVCISCILYPVLCITYPKVIRAG